MIWVHILVSYFDRKHSIQSLVRHDDKLYNIIYNNDFICFDALPVQVNLEEKKGVMSIDPKVTTPEQVRDHIDDMGFEATLLQGDSGVETCIVSIKGMTCNSCVRNIEGTVGGKPGVVSIKVSARPHKLKLKNLLENYSFTDMNYLSLPLEKSYMSFYGIVQLNVFS